MMGPVMSDSEKIISQYESDRPLIRVFHVKWCVTKITVFFFFSLLLTGHIIVF